ncbi:acetyl esterase [Biscogniauxia mediterranea]|nr:acetyl esterase [Biscogniauxia mediterranea]
MLQLTLLALTAVASASGIPGISSVENLITFGDSYTDEGRLQWFVDHNGTAPPAGTLIPTSNDTASGGYTWPHFVSQKLKSTTYNYAVSGAVCSNELIYRYLSSINGPYPSVIDYEVPAFLADVENSSSTSGGDALFPNRQADNTLYTLWVGTNDLGNGGYLLDKQRAGTTISDYVECVWSVLDGLYSGAGARHFVLFNQAPLDKSPLYAAPQHGGVGDTAYWTDKAAYNTTEIEQKMLEYTTTVNTVYAYGAPFQLLVRARWPGASLTIFDVHRLLSDVYADPAAYLDAPANATGYYYYCPYPSSEGACEDSEYPLSSFLWYDQLHPSSKTDEIIADEFVNLLSGDSPYGIYYDSSA